MSFEIKVSSPTRVDLAGGTLDFWPLFNFIQGCKTINLSIDIFTHVELTERRDTVIKVNIIDLSYSNEFSNISEALNCKDPEMSLLNSVFRFFEPYQGFEIRTQSESPVGGGLGGSSSLYISMLTAFSKWLDKDFELHEKIRLASNLESGVLHTPTGTQDYYPAARHGLGVIHYHPEGPHHELVRFPEGLFKKSMFLVNTGKSHHSGINNWQVYKAVVEKDKSTFSALEAIKNISNEMYSAIKDEEWRAFPKLFEREYEHRVQLAKCFTSPEIMKIQKIMKSQDADAVKICGAGGGGCVMVWSPFELKTSLMDLCVQEGFQVFDVSPVLDTEFYENKK